MLARLCGAAYLYIDSHPGATGHSGAKSLKIIGLIPAAGHATRLGSAVAGSKELIPIAATGAPARYANTCCCRCSVPASNAC